MVPSKKFDPLVKLLSADWFRPYVLLILPDVEVEHVQSIAKAARDAVTAMMDGETTYWNINFNQERLQRTLDAFVNSLRIEKLSESEIERILRACEHVLNSQAKQSSNATLWLFSMLTAALATGDRSCPEPEVSQEAREIIRREALKAKNENILLDFEEEALSSESTWDRYLRGLTPDLPTNLSDYASEYLGSVVGFEAYWVELRKHLQETELKRLTEWYLKESRKLAEPSFKHVIPSWMKQKR